MTREYTPYYHILIINVRLFFVFQGDDIGRWIIMGIFAKSQRAVPVTLCYPVRLFILCIGYDKSRIIDRREEIRHHGSSEELGGCRDLGQA